MRLINLEIQLEDWVNWIAQDADGYWQEFENEPVAWSSFFSVTKGQYGFLASGKSNPEWRKTKRRV